MTSTTQSVFVFFASFSVVIIAMDRMRFIVTPQKVQLSNKMVNILQLKVSDRLKTVFKGLLVSFLGLVLSVVFSYPLFRFTKIEVLFKDASYCYEVHKSKLFLTVWSMCVFLLRVSPRPSGGRCTLSSVCLPSSSSPPS